MLECNVVELHSVVGDKYSKYPEFANNVSLNKTSSVLLHDSG